MIDPHELVDDEGAEDRSDARRAAILTLVSLVVIVAACVMGAVTGIPGA